MTPRGPGAQLLNCLQRGELKQELCDRWDGQCRTAITTTGAVERAAVQATIDRFDFTSVQVIAPLQIIEAHRATNHYAYRFGGGLPSRTFPIPKPPSKFAPHETVYIKKLLDAYGDEKGTPFSAVGDLRVAPEFELHLQRSREHFFSAESLRAFSRDNVPPDTFEQLQEEFFDGIQEVYESDEHASGYQRVVKTVQQARNLAITGNPLIGVMRTNDRAGICHQLANNDRVTWVRKPDEEEQG